MPGHYPILQVKPSNPLYLSMPQRKGEGFNLSGAPKKAEADSPSVFPGTFLSPWGLPKICRNGGHIEGMPRGIKPEVRIKKKAPRRAGSLKRKNRVPTSD
jgi:hypothetical protein